MPKLLKKLKLLLLFFKFGDPDREPFFKDFVKIKINRFSRFGQNSKKRFSVEVPKLEKQQQQLQLFEKFWRAKFTSPKISSRFFPPKNCTFFKKLKLLLLLFGFGDPNREPFLRLYRFWIKSFGAKKLHLFQKVEVAAAAFQVWGPQQRTFFKTLSKSGKSIDFIKRWTIKVKDRYYKKFRTPQGIKARI